MYDSSKPLCDQDDEVPEFSSPEVIEAEDAYNKAMRVATDKALERIRSERASRGEQ